MQRKWAFTNNQAIRECKLCIGICIIVLEQQNYFQGTLDTFSQFYIKLIKERLDREEIDLQAS